MSISVILDTFKGTIDMAIREFAKVAAAKVCELIDEKKEDLWDAGLKVALTKFDEPEFNKRFIQEIVDKVKEKVEQTNAPAPSKEGSPPPPAVTGGASRKRKTRRNKSMKKSFQKKSRKQ
jgi:hypothetical protein